MMKWVLLLVFLNTLAFGQEVTINMESDRPIQISDGFILKFPTKYNQYISDHWSKGIIYYSNGSNHRYDSLNFNRFSGSIEVVINNKPLSLMPLGFEGALIYDSSHSGYVLMSARIDDNKTVVVVQSEGKYVLAAKVQVTETITSTSVNVDEIRFVAKPKSELSFNTNYYLLKDKRWQSFKLSKSNIIKLFSIDKTELKEFFAARSSRLIGENDLVDFFDHFNKKDD